MLKTLLTHPLARNLEIDAPETSLVHRRIIQEKSFLRKVYQEWYSWLAATLPGSPPGPVIELGSGGGFLNDFIPQLITSDLFPAPHIDLVFDAHQLPFGSGSLKGILMTNVFHHLTQPRLFFSEAARCLKPGGIMAMIEPWVTPWSSLIYHYLHHEPFDPEASNWELKSKGRLSNANDALPWIIFHRDKSRYVREFPEWELVTVDPIMPFCYLLSGGVSMRSLMPGWTFGFWQRVEKRFLPRKEKWALFVRIALVRRVKPSSPSGVESGKPGPQKA